MLGEKIGKFWCYFRCFFICRELPNEKEALVKIIKKPMFFLVFLVILGYRRDEKLAKIKCKQGII